MFLMSARCERCVKKVLKENHMCWNIFLVVRRHRRYVKKLSEKGHMCWILFLTSIGLRICMEKTVEKEPQLLRHVPYEYRKWKMSFSMMSFKIFVLKLFCYSKRSFVYSGLKFTLSCTVLKIYELSFRIRLKDCCFFDSIC